MAVLLYPGPAATEALGLAHNLAVHSPRALGPSDSCLGQSAPQATPAQQLWSKGVQLFLGLSGRASLPFGRAERDTACVSLNVRIQLLFIAVFFRESLQYVQRLREFPLFFSALPPPSGLQTHTLCCFDVISSKYFATERQCRVTEVLQARASGVQPSPLNNSSITH